MPAIRDGLAKINRTPATDEEFGQAEEDIKMLKNVEDALKSAKEKALNDTLEIKDLFAAIDAANDEIRRARIDLEKVIANEKDKRKEELIKAAIDALKMPLEQSTKFAPKLRESVKGKKTILSMRKALFEVVKESSKLVTENTATIDAFIADNSASLVPDTLTLATQTPEYVASELRRRLEAAKAEQERKRLEDEARKAREELKAAQEAAKTQVAQPERAPTPQPLAQIPVVQQSAQIANEPPLEIEIEAEWEATCNVIIGAFAVIKAHRETIRFEANKDRLAKFGDAVNQAWKNI